MKPPRNMAALAAFMKGDLENAVTAAMPGGIEAQEKEGQMLLVASSLMPFELRPHQADFEAVGFLFQPGGDGVLRPAQLPEGWTRRETSHSMASEILDQHGRRRVSVFYKAAFYDRKAHALLLRRYTLQTLYGDGVPGEIGTAVLDQDAEIMRFQSPTDPDRAERDARAWLRETYPAHGSLHAYWTDPADPAVQHAD